MIRPLGLLALAALAAASPVAGAQSADSLAAFATARRAQERFESVRRGALPMAARVPRVCDARLGRFCQWYDPGARPPEPREHARVTRARRTLLTTLDSLARLHPGDAWVVGQRVRYRIDGGDTTGAVAVAESQCGAAAWWCAALLGYARHVAGDFAAAEQAFDRALTAMDSTRRCEWDDPSVLLEPDARRRWTPRPCAARGTAVPRLWWLMDPLWALGANDLRTEFLARRTFVALEHDARLAYDVVARWDTAELLLRYGWPVWWIREHDTGGGMYRSPTLVGFEAVPSFAFAPSARLVADTAALPRPDDWEPMRRQPASRYAPRYAAVWRNAGAQVARFRRGDSVLVLAAYETSSDSVLGAGSDARLAVAASHRDAPALSAIQRGTRGTAAVRLPLGPPAPLHASIEITDGTTRGVARHRVGLPPMSAGRISVSDLLFHTPPDSGERAGARVEDLSARMLPATTVRGDRVGVYWETYGLAADGEPVSVSLTLERTDTPWVRRAATRLGLATRSTPLRIQWHERPDAADAVAARSVTVNVRDLAAGEYRVRLTVRGADGATAFTERLLGVRRQP